MQAQLSPAQAQALQQSFTENYLQVLQLNDVLKEERALLAGRNSKQLVALLERKEKLLTLISESEKAMEKQLSKYSRVCRTTALKRKQSASSTSNLLQSPMVNLIIENCPTQCQGPFRRVWQQLLQALNETQSLIAVNRQIVHHVKKNVDSVLALIKGTDKSASLYQADGHTEGYTQARYLAEA